MNFEMSPVLNKRGNLWVDMDDTAWAEVDCLVQHFHLSSDVKSIEFAKGECREALRMQWEGDTFWSVRRHRARVRDTSQLRMLGEMNEWLRDAGTVVWISVIENNIDGF